MKRTAIAAVAVAIALAGCGGIPIAKEDQGLVLGGVLGGVLGSQVGGGSGRIVGAVAGTLLGGYLGREVGRYMDRQDRASHEHALTNTVVYGGRNDWANPRTRNRGYVEEVGSYQAAFGYCREYRQRVWIGDRMVEGYGTACRQPDGSWRIMN